MFPPVPPRRGLPANPTLLPVSSSRGLQRTPSALEKEQVLQLLAAPNQREYTGFRDYVLLTVLFDTGLRINETLNLTVDDLNLTDKTITVRASVAKNGKSRPVPIGKCTAELLAVLIEENQKQFTSRNPSTVFLLNNGKPLTYNQAYERIRLHGEKAVRKYVQLNQRDLQKQHAQSSPLVGV
ncbi:tyrosine-type recombinase/integrase [Cohnella cellulosilytica]|uniref:Tyrosine-type recombinase/integrase n=1 Tax=Cohnella cellulosilytica TaxID=986710 RepID=A0ABW2F7B0_9BACL